MDPSNKKPENVIVKPDSFAAEHEYLFGKKNQGSKIIDVQSNQDFPDMILGGEGPIFEKKAS